MHLQRWLTAFVVSTAAGAVPTAAGSQQPAAAPSRAPARDTARRAANNTAGNTAGSTARDSGTAVVRGAVVDGLTGLPLPGADVQFVAMVNGQPSGQAFSATADSAGRYELAKLARGRYVVGFYHPILDSLRIEAPLRVADVNRPTARVDVGTPSRAALREAFCGAQADADSSGMLMGWVYDAAARAPVRGSTVLVTWRDLVVDDRGMRLEHRRGEATPDSAGFYAICGLPAQLELLATADAGKRHTGLVAIRMPPRGVLRQNFALGDSASAPVATTAAAEPPRPAGGAPSAGDARVSGRVLDAAGKPIRNANVTLWGVDAKGTTSDAGTFTVASVPAGTYTLEVRALGYTPARVPVDIARSQTARVAVTLDEAVPVLAPVTVKGKADRHARELTAFLQRRAHGQGRYITREDLDRRNPTYVSDVLSSIPGLRVSPGARGERSVFGRGGCRPAVLLDGMPIMQGSESLDALAQPGDVAGIEVYSGGGTTPGEFSAYDNGCGVIVVWTRR